MSARGPSSRSTVFVARDDLVRREVRRVLAHGDRADLGAEFAGRLRGERLLVRRQRERVLVLARDLPLRRDLLGREAHAVRDADVLVAREHRLVDREPPEHRDHAHALGARRDHDVRLAGADPVGRDRHRVQAGRAEAVDRHAGHAVRQAGQQHADARDVHALLVLGHRAADDHVLDALGVDAPAPAPARSSARARAACPAASSGTRPAAPCRPRCAWRRRCRHPASVSSWFAPSDLHHKGHGEHRECGLQQRHSRHAKPGTNCLVSVLSCALCVSRFRRRAQFRSGLPVFSVCAIRACVFSLRSSSMNSRRSSSSSHVSSTRLPGSTSPPHSTRATRLPTSKS